MARIFYTIAITILLLSCGRQKNKEDKKTIDNGNISTTISSDTSKLSKIINLDSFRPTTAKFKYISIDNSGQNTRLSVPGPSDNYLEAVLYFDTMTFKVLREKYLSVDYHLPNLGKQKFNFEWLDKEIRNELKKCDTTNQGRPDFFLGLGHSGHLWLLDNKLLLIKSTD